MPMISTPFPYIAVHIMQSPRICGEAGYICRLLAKDPLLAITKHFSAIIIGQGRADRGTTMKRRGGARPAGVLPLGFTGKCLVLAGAQC